MHERTPDLLSKSADSGIPAWCWSIHDRFCRPLSKYSESQHEYTGDNGGPRSVLYRVRQNGMRINNASCQDCLGHGRQCSPGNTDQHRHCDHRDQAARTPKRLSQLQTKSQHGSQADLNPQSLRRESIQKKPHKSGPDDCQVRVTCRGDKDQQDRRDKRSAHPHDICGNEAAMSNHTQVDHHQNANMSQHFQTHSSRNALFMSRNCS